MTKALAVLVFLLSGAAFAQSNCITRDLAIPSTVTGEITVGSCKQGSEYHDIYYLRGMTAGRQLRFVLTRTTLTTLSFEMTRVQDLKIIDIVNTSEYGKTLTVDVEIPVTQDVYSVFISGILSLSTGGYTLSVMDLHAPSPATQIVPIVGRLQGGSAAFRSDLKLYNPTGAPITGSLVFTPRGQSASDADVTVRYNIPAQGVAFYEDVYSTAFPGGSGAARLAIVPDTVAGKPVVDSSTYTALSDGGELAQSPTVFTGATLYGLGWKLLGMLGKNGERSNLFVMTGNADTTIVWVYRDANGVSKAAATRSYPPHSTTQFAAADLFSALPPNGSVEASITTGSARIAVSPVNNVSNQGRWIDFRPSL